MQFLRSLDSRRTSKEDFFGQYLPNSVATRNHPIPYSTMQYASTVFCNSIPLTFLLNNTGIKTETSLQFEANTFANIDHDSQRCNPMCQDCSRETRTTTTSVLLFVHKCSTRCAQGVDHCSPSPQDTARHEQSRP